MAAAGGLAGLWVPRSAAPAILPGPAATTRGSADPTAAVG
jgi:hypothetical protein